MIRMPGTRTPMTGNVAIAITIIITNMTMTMTTAMNITIITMEACPGRAKARGASC